MLFIDVFLRVQKDNGGVQDHHFILRRRKNSTMKTLHTFPILFLFRFNLKLWTFPPTWKIPSFLQLSLQSHKESFINPKSSGNTLFTNRQGRNWGIHPCDWIWIIQGVKYMVHCGSCVVKESFTDLSESPCLSLWFLRSSFCLYEGVCLCLLCFPEEHHAEVSDPTTANQAGSCFSESVLKQNWIYPVGDMKWGRIPNSFN